MRTLAVFRTAIPTLLFSSRNPTSFRKSSSVLLLLHSSLVKPNFKFASLSSLSSPDILIMEKQFEEFRTQLDNSGSVKEKIRTVVNEMESVNRLIHASLLLVHQSRPFPEVLEKAKNQIEALKGLFAWIGEIIKECPGQYYRYHGDWKNETQTAVSLIGFLHWLETGKFTLAF